MTVQKPSGAVDFGYLEDFAAGDRQVVLEVLALFQDQARRWAVALTSDNPGWGDLMHTIKGAARGVGANSLGEVSARAEAAGPAHLAAVQAALAAAVAEIAAYQARHGGT